MRMFELDYGDRRPIYEQIKEKFKFYIISGALREGDQLPSVRELSADTAINPNTIQHAFKELEHEGYIYSQKAKGYFVAPQVQAVKQKADDTWEKLREALRELRYLGVGKQEMLAEIESLFSDTSTQNNGLEE